MKKVFLGGTVNGSLWRDELIPLLNIDYFNPVVDDWNEESQNEELRQRENCDFLLYVITPKMKGVYSIAELVDDSNKKPEKTLFCFLNWDDDSEFEEHQKKSLAMVARMVCDKGGCFFNTLEDVAEYLNKQL